MHFNTNPSLWYFYDVFRQTNRRAIFMLFHMRGLIKCQAGMALNWLHTSVHFFVINFPGEKLSIGKAPTTISDRKTQLRSDPKHKSHCKLGLPVTSWYVSFIACQSIKEEGFLFPASSTTADYIDAGRLSEPLDSFTLCVWIKFEREIPYGACIFSTGDLLNMQFGMYMYSGYLHFVASKIP